MNKKFIFCISAVCFLLAVGIIGIIILNNISTNNKIINIYSEGSLYRSISVKPDDDYEFTVINSDGNKNTVLVKNNTVSVIYADCPDKICVHSQPISDGLLPIVCVPNGLIIKSEASNDE